ncbi:MAG: type II toxin-antitoxin system death-on-curing family toxin [Chloroflexi bacterium]|nr:type II toxin-antitoxin system death-on-curing family toxin [Chloroflexota bacterium]
MEYLTVEEILAIHIEVIREFGGTPEVLSLERLRSSAESPHQTMFGDELYPDLVSKAAILFFALIKNHPFLDGNKRTALLSLLEFVKRNGHAIEAKHDELYQFTLDVATSVLDKDAIGAWIRAHLKESAK